MRKNTRAVRIGGVTVGGGNPVAVQSMLNVPIHDIAGNVAQAKRLEAEGCQIVRVTVPSVADVPVVEALKNAVKMPVVPCKGHPHPHRRKRRQPGKGDPCKIRKGYAGSAGGERDVPCIAAGKARFQRYCHLYQILQCPRGGGSIPPAQPAVRLPSACGRYRGRYIPYGPY